MAKRKSSKKTDFMKKFKKKAEKEKTTGYGADDRYYFPKKDADGNINVKLRFLPYIYEDDEDSNKDIVGFIEKRKHMIYSNSNNRSFRMLCPRTYNKTMSLENECPICDIYFTEYQEANEEKNEKEKKYLQDEAKKKKPTTKFVANVLIIDDPVEPENNGQVKLFQFGFQVRDKIYRALNLDDDGLPKDEDEVDGNVFDPYEGFNFSYRMRKKDGRNNYETSRFINNSTPISENDDEIEEILDRMYDLNELRNEIISHFKTAEEIEEKYNKFLGSKETKKMKKAKNKEDIDEFEDEDETTSKKSKKSKRVKAKEEEIDDDVFDEEEKIEESSSDSDDELFDDEDLFDD